MITRPTLVWSTALAVAVVVVLAVGGLLLSRGREAALGARLFAGELPLAGRVVGHEEDLPAQASRCANCHLAATPAQASASSPVTTQRFGPALTAALLKETRARRGGPPSRYDLPALCTLLRTGLDPAKVLIPRSMPRYAIDDAQCAALWAHVSAQ